MHTIKGSISPLQWLMWSLLFIAMKKENGVVQFVWRNSRDLMLWKDILNRVCVLLSSLHRSHVQIPALTALVIAKDVARVAVGLVENGINRKPNDQYSKGAVPMDPSQDLFDFSASSDEDNNAPQKQSIQSHSHPPKEISKNHSSDCIVLI